MKEKISDYKKHFTDKQFLTSFLMSIIFLAASIVINFYAGTYATESISNSVTDIILSNTRAYDLDGVFVYGSIIFFFFIVFVCAMRPHQMPFAVKSIALFIIIRSIFITLTHIGPFPSQIYIDSNILNKLTFGGDLFFSGHTGLPFLLALVFWKDKIIRYIFILFSLTFAVVVLLSHMHYTIDVLSAFFITYTIFHIAEFAFSKDKMDWD
ncbi:MAG: phosphatase PAP2-related protein [Patescibacteria group bacterium]